MTFSTNWFETSAKANFETHLLKFKNLPELHFLEIGCFEGKATLWLLQNILTDQSSKITVVDTFLGSIEHQGEYETKNLYQRFLENIEPHKEKVIIEKGKSQIVLRGLTTQFDFIYVDGSHLACDVLEDGVLAFRLLKDHGVMIFDDYEWAEYDEPVLTPKPGIDAFLSGFKGKFDLLSCGYQVIIRKKRHAPGK